MFYKASDLLPFIVQLAFGFALFFAEKTGKFQLSYSKFRKGGNMNPRLAMFLIYFPAPIIYTMASMSGGLKNSPYHDALFYCFLFHFGKRCLEILFVHKYSRPMGFGTVLLIGSLYGSIGWTAGTLHSLVSKEVGESSGVIPFLVIGGIVFAIGQAINLYHHVLLAGLRKEGSTAYIVPDGGLFSKVVCPHYLGEIMAWFGYAAMSGFLPMLGIAFIMSLYLTGRSLRTVSWYKENVSGFPGNRRALIPGIL